MSDHNGQANGNRHDQGGTGQGGGIQWWRSLLAAIGVALGGILLALTGVKGQLDSHEREMFRVQAEQRSQQKNIDRIEDKLDKLIDLLRKK